MLTLSCPPCSVVRAAAAGAVLGVPVLLHAARNAVRGEAHRCQPACANQCQRHTLLAGGMRFFFHQQKFRVRERFYILVIKIITPNNNIRCYFFIKKI